MASAQGWHAWARYWRCECGATVACPVEPPLCPRTNAHSTDARPRFGPLPGPVPFDFLVVPGACRRCGGAMVATRLDMTNVLACANCADCRWRWFLCPDQVEGVRDVLPRQGKNAR